jgi:hypothetical protein
MLTQIDYLTPEKSDELITKIKNVKHKVLILLMHDAGLRVSEAVSLRISDFDFRKRVINVKTLKKRRKKNSKRSDRPIPISTRLYNALAEYLKKESISDGWLLPSPKNEGEHLTRFAASQMLIRFKKKNPGFHGLHPHTLRHTFATNLLANKTDLTAIRDLLGHEDIRTTTIYTHTPLEVVRQQIEKSAQKEQSLKDRVLAWFKPEEVELKINIGQANSFLVGRRDELAQLQTNIQKNINTIVLGGIGTGKSTLLENISTEKKVLHIDDTSDFKKTLINALMHLFEHDKEAVMQLMYPKHTLETVRIPLTKHSMVSLAKTLIDITDRYEYVLIIDNVDRITPRVVKVLEVLKDHFTIITTAREVALNKGSFLWNFETIKLLPLSRSESLELIHRLAYDVELEDAELFRNHIWEQSDGNPRVIFELVERYRKEAFVTNDVVRQVRHYGALPEWDLSFMILLVLGGLAILRYLAHETGDASLRFIGGVAMILLIVFRQFFTKTKRKFIR